MIPISRKNLIIIAGVLLLTLSLIGYGIVHRLNSNSITFKDSNLSDTNEAENVEQAKTSDKQETNTEQTIVIHIIGQVKKPGIVKILQGGRIADAVEAAGGFKEGADIEAVNLAFKLEDGQQVYIPQKESISTQDAKKTSGSSRPKNSDKNTKRFVPGVQPSSTNNMVSSSAAGVKSVQATQNGNTADGNININSADLKGLDALPGVGPATAQKIIDYRNTNGAFKVPEDIMKVKGIGKSKYEQIKGKVTV